MKIPQFVKYLAIVIIALLMALSSLLPPAAIVSAQNSGTTTPNLKIENFKWQDVLLDGWSVDSNNPKGRVPRAMPVGECVFARRASSEA